MRNLRSVNLNLMPILRELLRKRNVTHAAQALNMSQPAVSDALSRLRQMFQDEILIAEGRELRLTSRAERIQQIVEDSLAQIESLTCDAPLDITTVQGVIKIATADYVVQAFGRSLIARVAQAAPGLTLQFLNIDVDTAHHLSRGAIDFILTPSMGPAGSFERALLFEDRVVCIVPKRSSYGEQLSDEEFWSARHAAYVPGEQLTRSLHSSVLQTMGRHEFNAVLVPNLLLLPLVVEAADAIALLPQRLADTEFVRSHARVAELPFAFPPLRISAAWHSSRNSDAVHRWMREQMVELSRAETAPDAPAAPAACA